MNPFSYGTVVRDSCFFDREKECDRIVNTLSGGNNLVLYAPRRFGKTSLVFKAMESLNKAGFTCVYFDFMQVYSVESFVRLYSKTLSKHQKNIRKFARLFSSLVSSLRPVITIGNDGTPEFSIDFANETVDETLVSDLLALPEKMATKEKRILIFFDEFQEVEKLKSINFEAILRSKIQQQQYVNYLFLGSKTHLIKEMFSDRNRPFYNAASQMTLGYLPEKDTVNYIQTKFSSFGITINEATVKYMATVTKRIPHYIQLLAAEIWQYVITDKKIVTKAIVDLCVQQIIALKNDYYMELFDRQSKTKKSLLVALARSGKSIYSSDYIRSNTLPSASTLQRAVKELVNVGIIDKMKDEYFITDPFFQLFLLEF
ncbi:MAG: ATP-binding protein [Tannerella sp.]|jgi:AAA+ ATPase superfamily predicted ATPase|nr:ATP-binding protein [Tannerella sp.]